VVSWATCFVVYFNHTHPNIPWYQNAADWRREFNQFEGATMLRSAGIWQWLVPGAIMNHTAHQYDPRIPVGNLEAAHHHIVRDQSAQS
ncbi:MAG: hypothetical protein ACKVGZ_10285, partial [Alphaproteobacteria bacterium]